ncbi:MAG: pyridoxamine 5'-phosphate oxidase family protein [Candidatus Rifleibacteriota bacterium]
MQTSNKNTLNFETATTEEIIRFLLFQQKTGILATIDNDKPYTSVVGFATTPDIKELYFGTPEATLKYQNILSNPNVAMLIDNRQNLGSDFSNAAALTVMGTVKKSGEEEINKGRNLLIKRHPELKTFLNSPTCRIVKIMVSKYSLVLRFQEVSELEISEDK